MYRLVDGKIVSDGIQMRVSGVRAEIWDKDGLTVRSIVDADFKDLGDSVVLEFFDRADNRRLGHMAIPVRIRDTVDGLMGPLEVLAHVPLNHKPRTVWNVKTTGQNTGSAIDEIIATVAARRKQSDVETLPWRLTRVEGKLLSEAAGYAYSHANGAASWDEIHEGFLVGYVGERDRSMNGD